MMVHKTMEIRISQQTMYVILVLRDIINVLIMNSSQGAFVLPQTPPSRHLSLSPSNDLALRSQLENDPPVLSTHRHRRSPRLSEGTSHTSAITSISAIPSFDDTAIATVTSQHDMATTLSESVGATATSEFSVPATATSPSLSMATPLPRSASPPERATTTVLRTTPDGPVPSRFQAHSYMPSDTPVVDRNEFTTWYSHFRHDYMTSALSEEEEFLIKAPDVPTAASLMFSAIYALANHQDIPYPLDEPSVPASRLANCTLTAIQSLFPRVFMYVACLYMKDHR